MIYLGGADNDHPHISVILFQLFYIIIVIIGHVDRIK